MDQVGAAVPLPVIAPQQDAAGGPAPGHNPLTRRFI